ncbi:MAG: hypothetical protein GY828_01400, partial [Candidatus Gracilibacteria bacterium]|nr:hypothetical protein [Candidatus Gracilibacteria bacterium]
MELLTKIRTENIINNSDTSEDIQETLLDTTDEAYNIFTFLKKKYSKTPAKYKAALTEYNILFQN